MTPNATIARITSARIVHYVDNGETRAYIGWVDSRGRTGETSGHAESAPMQALLARARREGIRVKKEQAGWLANGSSKHELAEMEQLLAQAGYDPDDAKRLQREGMGPSELEERLRERGGLSRTHGLEKSRALATNGAAAYRRGSRAIAAQIDRERRRPGVTTHCAGRMENGPGKRYAKCSQCGRIDYDKYEGDTCGGPVRP